MEALPPLQEHVELGAELGRGAFGVVHRGRLTGGRAVAVKLHASLPAGEEARVHREAELLRGLRHPRLVAFHGLLRGPGGQLALVYDLVEGVELEERLQQGPLTLVETLVMATGIAEGLDALHQLGLVHRDLKPGNVMVGPDGSPRLIDYGMLRPTTAGRTLTATGTVVGTPAYMAPEQIAGTGRPSPALDQYALGCLVYECLAGLPPFAGGISEILDGHMKQRPPRLRERAPHLPGGLQAVLDRMLAKEPATRFESCGEAIRSLDAARRLQVPASQATQMLSDSGVATATRPLDKGESGSREPVEATAPLPGPTPGLEVGTGSMVPRVAFPLLVAAGLIAGFLGEPGTGAGGAGEAVEARPKAPEVDFPWPPVTPEYPISRPFSGATRLEWSKWEATDPGTPLYQADLDRDEDVDLRNLPVLLGDDLLAVTTSRGGVALLERVTLAYRASWRLEPLNERDPGGGVVERWFSPFLAPGPGGAVWLATSARGSPPASLRLAPPASVRGHQAGRLVPRRGGGGWENVEVFEKLPRDNDPQMVRVEGTGDSHDGRAWIGNADTPGYSSWIREEWGPPRPLATLLVPMAKFPELVAMRGLLGVSGREIPMRSFQAGGGWVRGAAAEIKPRKGLSPAEEAEVGRRIAALPGSRGSVQGRPAYSLFAGESAGTSTGPGPRHWELPLTGYPEVYPHPFDGGFLMVHGGRLLHYPASALHEAVAPEAATELDVFAYLCPEERYRYPAGTMTYDERSGLDLLLWENLRFCRGQDVDQRIAWYRYPEFRLEPDGSVHVGPRSPVAYWELDLETMGVDRPLMKVERSMSLMDFTNLVKNPGFRRDQRLPGGRLWVVGLTSIDQVNRILVLDLAAAEVVDTLEAGNLRAIQAGPVLYRGNQPGSWEVYFSDRGGRLLGARLPRTRPEDG